ncbi:MAG: metallophosphoesterase [Thermoleophilia bacterium]|nr:metallophosphoesterase [Thermoleophilia bacterium]
MSSSRPPSPSSSSAGADPEFGRAVEHDQRRRTFTSLYQRASADIIVTRKVRIPGGENGALLGHRFVVATDMHARDDWFPEASVHELVRHINAVDDVNAVVLVGDFVGNDASAIDWSAGIYADINAPTYATLGNHDHWTDPVRIERALTASGIDVLTNRNIELAPGLVLAGIDSCWGGTANPELALAGKDPDAKTVVLGHEPYLATKHNEFLHIAGHTHSGQVRLPIPVLGNVLTRLYMPRYSQPFPRRFYNRGNGSYVYTSAGVGYSTINWRFATPPEIVIIDI